MAKRFTDTNKYKKPFVRSLPGAYKLFWDFLYHDCDHAGIWIVDMEIAQSYLGKDMPVTMGKALELFNKDELRIVQIENGRKWFIAPFIEFQYGQLSEKNRAHVSVINILLKFNLIDPVFKRLIDDKVHTSPLQGGKDMDKDKELDKDKEKDSEPEKFSDKWFGEIFDEILVESIKSTFPKHNLENEFKIFRLKVRGSPADYEHRDTGGIRQAFIYQLKNSKVTNGNRTGNSESTRRADAIIETGKEFGKL